ncbi:MAG: hypothetical protein JST30_05055 [Armatimonadetes bacterium]|nr:hypothetical protein [Armatimonadota bacterium]
MRTFLTLSTLLSMAAMAQAQPRFAVEAMGTGNDMTGVFLKASNMERHVSGVFRATIGVHSGGTTIHGTVTGLTWNLLGAKVSFQADCLDAAGNRYFVDGTVADKGASSLDMIDLRVTSANRSLFQDRSTDQYVKIWVFPG